MQQNNKRKLGYILASIGFFINFVSIILLTIPLITRNINNTIRFTGIGLFFFGAIFIISGLLLIIKTND
ncbi:MAG: hypothetical protein K6G28_03315 [Acholeplasmatales bacterium]|nr:hypothetical protein [Acholeplasmatales bacterium]